MLVHVLLLLVLALSGEGLHHNGRRRSYAGKLTPTIKRIRDSMKAKLVDLKQVLAGTTTAAPTTTTAAPASTVRSDGDDILADSKPAIVLASKDSVEKDESAISSLFSFFVRWFW